MKIFQSFVFSLILVACGDVSTEPRPDSLTFGSDVLTASPVDAGPTDAASADLGSWEDVGSAADTMLDVGSAADTMPDEGAPADTWVDPEVAINAGFIGGPCESDADCPYEGGFCFTEEEGFPWGMCSSSCDLYCPDQEGFVTTFCIDAGSADVPSPPGLCTMRCDVSQSESGCRPGYQCVFLPRHGDPGTVIESCIPESVAVAQPVDPTNCQQQLIDLGVSFTPASNPKDSPDGHPELVCDIQDPIMLTGTLHGVNFRYNTMESSVKAMFMTCPLALALEKMALVLASNGVTDVLHLGVYNCRVVSGTTKISQHGMANAIDIRALVADTGETYVVLNDWEKNTEVPMTVPGEYLKWFAQTLYVDWIFNVILTPDFNAAHNDHFHIDLTPGSHFLK